jgi:thioredoxin-related protein
MRGAMSYPTSIFFEENFANPQPVPGYLDIKNIQPILNYLGGNHQKTTPYQDYQKAFVITWE